MRFTHHIAASIKFRVAWDSRLTGPHYMFHMFRDQDPISILKTTCEVAIRSFHSIIFLTIPIYHKYIYNTFQCPVR